MEYYKIYTEIKSKFYNNIGVKERYQRFCPFQVQSLANMCDFEQLYILSSTRKSIRWYEQIPVDRDKVDKAIEIALMSPSACNRQPFRFLVYDDVEMIQKLACIPMGTEGFYQNFPGLIVVLGELSAFEHQRDRHLIYIDGSMATMSLLYGLHAQGIGACCLNWPEVPSRERKLAEILRLKEHERPIMFVSYGYPDGKSFVPYSMKKTLNEIRMYNPYFDDSR